MKLRCAVPDDYQSVAATAADRSPVADDIDMVGFAGHCATEDEPAARLAEFDIVVRERVPFPATLIERLPRLRLIVAWTMCRRPTTRRTTVTRSRTSAPASTASPSAGRAERCHCGGAAAGREALHHRPVRRTLPSLPPNGPN
jgi:hypothetical protein